MDNLIGPNLLLTVIVPYLVVTGLQDTYLQLGLIIASAWAGVHLVVHALLFVFNKSKVFPYILEIVQVVLYPILLGICATNDNAKNAIQLYFNFIVLATLAGTSLISLIIAYPLGLQHVQELVPWVYSRHEDVLKLGYHTTSVFCATTTALCLLYLIPVARGVAENHYHALNLIFRLILPTVMVALVVIIMRVWPDIALGCLQGAASGPEDLWKYPVVIAPNGGTRVIDNAMFAHPTKVAINPYAVPYKPAPNSGVLALRPGHAQQQHGGANYSVAAKPGYAQPAYPDKAQPTYAIQPPTGYSTGFPNHNSSYAMPPPAAQYAPAALPPSLHARPQPSSHAPEVLQAARPQPYPQPPPAGLYKVHEPPQQYAGAPPQKPGAYLPPPPPYGAPNGSYPAGTGGGGNPKPGYAPVYGSSGVPAPSGGSYQPGYGSPAPTGGNSYQPGYGGPAPAPGPGYGNPAPPGPTPVYGNPAPPGSAPGYGNPAPPGPTPGSYQPAPYQGAPVGSYYPAMPAAGPPPRGSGSGPAGYAPAPHHASAGGGYTNKSDYKIPAYYSTPGGRP